MSVNRRSFLTSSVITAGMLASSQLGLDAQTRAVAFPGPPKPTPPHTPPVRPANWPNSMLVSTAVAAQIVTTANTFAGSVKSGDWAGMSRTSAALAANIKQAGTDAAIRGLAAQVNASKLNPNWIDKASIVKAVQVYQPRFTMGHLDNFFKAVPTDPPALTRALNSLKANGISPALLATSTRFSQMAAYINPAGGRTTLFGSSTASPNLFIYPQPGGGGGGGYTCADDGLASLAFGTVFAVLAIMAAPEMAGVLAGGAILSAFIDVGSVTAGVWGLGHAVVCGF